MESAFCRSGIACSPFAHVETKRAVRSSNSPFGDQTVPLVALTVAFSSVVTEGNRPDQTGFKIGDQVYVRASSIAQGWAKEVLTAPGSKSFIVVPIHEVVLIDRAPAALPPLPARTREPGPGIISG